MHVRTRCIAIRLTLGLKRGTSEYSACASLLAILGIATSVHPWTSPFAFLHALSSALIDAIPLMYSLSKETSSSFGVDGGWNGRRAMFELWTQIRLGGRTDEGFIWASI
ncbi:MAG: hypothetical protein Q8911_10175 [Bacillota bacterium]|nr:hypothetical protein [Bacillota bacterium]